VTAKVLGIAVHFAVELRVAVQVFPVGGVILMSFNVEQGPGYGTLGHQDAGGFFKVIVVFI
jgi:hypothetical protein